MIYGRPSVSANVIELRLPSCEACRIPCINLLRVCITATGKLIYHILLCEKGVDVGRNPVVTAVTGSVRARNDRNLRAKSITWHLKRPDSIELLLFILGIYTQDLACGCAHIQAINLRPWTGTNCNRVSFVSLVVARVTDCDIGLTYACGLIPPALCATFPRRFSSPCHLKLLVSYRSFPGLATAPHYSSGLYLCFVLFTFVPHFYV